MSQAGPVHNLALIILLSILQLATKLDSDWAALSIANLMPDPQTVQLAIRYDARLGRQNLASRLGEVALRKEQEDEEDDDGEGEGSDYAAEQSEGKENGESDGGDEAGRFVAPPLFLIRQFIVLQLADTRFLVPRLRKVQDWCCWGIAYRSHH